MNSEKETFTIDFLDHVAIRVKDLERSANWYEKVLGLKRYQLPEWGPFPIFMLAGKSGVALFPKKTASSSEPIPSEKTCVDHFAFHVSNANFEKAQIRCTQMGQKFSLQDHHYFHSIYLKDPDGHTVELTTLMVDPDQFYK